MARILLCLFLFFPPFLNALEIFESAQEQAWTFLYNEDHRWFADTLTLDQEDWPVLQQSKSAPAKASLQRQFRPGLVRLNQPPFEGQELKNKNGLTLWTVTNEWDWNWEIKYADWVKREIDPHWWKANNISTDCADVVYSARWIFARIHGLPMANHLISGHIFSHKSVRSGWERLPTAPEWQNDQRFLAALEYLLTKAYTHTLWKDSYPVAITKSAMLPGGYHLRIDQTTGHTQFIWKVGTIPEELPLLTLNSTVPRELRDMMEFVFFEYTSDAAGSGFVRMRWPVFESNGIRFVAPELMPYYSVEQFGSRFIQGGRNFFWEEVYFRLNPRANFDKIALKSAQQIVEQFKARVPVVEQGYRFCSATPCIAGTPEYDTWSTPSRDRRITQAIEVFDALSPMISVWTPITAALRTQILTMDWRTYNAGDFASKWRAREFTSNPNDPPRVRWGLGYY